MVTALTQRAQRKGKKERKGNRGVASVIPPPANFCFPLRSLRPLRLCVEMLAFGFNFYKKSWHYNVIPTQAGIQYSRVKAIRSCILIPGFPPARE
jgi:hypothetical protein